jgi:exopolysaccharide biosynthesis predicted pyruvyltransferase EpsI
MQLPRVSEALRRWSGQPASFVSLPGNNGDRLIEIAGRAALSECGLVTARRPESAAVIVVNGGGAMAAGFRGLEALAALARRFPRTPLVVLPSLFDVLAPSFHDALQAHRAPVLLFAREEASLQALVAAGIEKVAEVGVDHDMAFSLRDSDFLRTLRTSTAASHLLVVERTDREEFTGRRDVLTALEREQPAWVRAAFPAPLRRGVREGLAVLRRRAFRMGALRDESTPFARAARALVSKDMPALAHLPVLAADISQTSLCGFDTFCRLIAESAAVVTTRLHVAVLAALLDKQVYIAPGPGPKLRAVYEYSMAAMPNVHLWDWPGEHA